MEISVSQFGELGTKVVLVGKLDISGAEKIDVPLATVAGSRGNIVVDMAGVDFIASIGIRHLVMAAKAVARKSGMLVLLDPNPIVTEVLFTSSNKYKCLKMQWNDTLGECPSRRCGWRQTALRVVPGTGRRSIPPT